METTARRHHAHHGETVIGGYLGEQSLWNHDGPGIRFEERGDVFEGSDSSLSRDTGVGLETVKEVSRPTTRT
jgi:hypothetical protein